VVFLIWFFCCRLSSCGDDGSTAVSARPRGRVIYGIHLLTIATLNALLWILGCEASDAKLLATAFIPDSGIRDRRRRSFAPAVAQFTWCSPFWRVAEAGSPDGRELISRGGAKFARRIVLQMGRVYCPLQLIS